MFVSEYATYIQPQQYKQETKHTTYGLKDSLSSFDTTYEALTQLSTSKPSSVVLPVDYRTSRNYYANRYKLSSNTKEPEALTQFKTTQVATQLAPTYNSVFTTFYDLTKPKKALIEPSYKEQSEYDLLKKEQAKQTMVQTYIANDAYYNKVAVS